MIPPNPNEKPLLRPTEVAEILDISLSSVYRMIRNKELPVIQLGGRKSTRIVTAELRRQVMGLN